MAVGILVAWDKLISQSPEPGCTTKPELQGIDQEALRRTLSQGDEETIIEMLNAVKSSPYSEGMLRFIHALWKNDIARYPDLNWKVIDKDRIRIELVDILVQAELNGFGRFVDKDMHNFARQSAASSSSAVSRMGALVLGTIDDPSDVSLLADIALKQDEETFRAAIVALSEMCNPLSDRTLQHLRREVKNESFKFQIEQISSRINERQRETRLCERRNSLAIVSGHKTVPDTDL